MRHRGRDLTHMTLRRGAVPEAQSLEIGDWILEIVPGR
jgi:hypothetical protein